MKRVDYKIDIRLSGGQKNGKDILSAGLQPFPFGSEDCGNHRIWQPGTCPRAELEGFGRACYHRALRGKQVLGEGRKGGI